MSLVISARPSTYSASANPIVYTGYRADFTDIIEVTDQGGFARIKINNDVTASFAVDDSIYLIADPSLYSVAGSVTAVVLSAGDTLVDTDIPFTVNYDSLGGYAARVNNFTLRPGYRVNVQIFNADDNTLLVDDTFTYTTKRSGDISIDISSPLADLLSAELEMCPTENVVVSDTNRFKYYYIKYQEVWIGSSESYTNDSANKKYVLLAGMQIGGTNDLTERGTSWATDIDEWRIVSGEQFEVPLFNIDGVMIVQRFKGGVLQSQDAFAVVATIGRVKIEPDSTENELLIAIGDTAIKLLPPNTSWADTVGTTVKDANSFTDGPGTGINTVRQAFASVDGRIIMFSVDLQTAAGAGGHTCSFTFDMITALGVSKVDTTYAYTSRVFNNSGNMTQTATVIMKVLEGGNACAYLRCQTNRAGSQNFEVTLNDVNDIVSYSGELGPAKTAWIVDPCRPVTLCWANKVGGEEGWTFENNQEVTVITELGKKAKRLTLFASSLTEAQWDAINDLNSIGEIYRVAIPELTADVLATSKQVGQQVYMVNDDGDGLIGVIVIPNSVGTMTKRARHDIQITIELPELQLPG
jgi:hypothetical protein